MCVNVAVASAAPSAAVGPAFGHEIEDTAVRSRPGCTWQSGPYWCQFCVGTFAAACPYI